MIVHTQPRIGLGFVTGEGEMIAVIRQEFRQKFVALRIVHGPIEQEMSEPRGFRQRSGKVGVPGRQFLGHDAAGEVIGARAAQRLR